jgi:ATP-dependent Clp protease ATP-binding subunit ClpX
MTVPSLRDLITATMHVKGQAEVKKRLAWTLRRQIAVAQGKLPDSPAGAIATGSTGVGKTYLTREMCRSCGLPFAEVKATQYTDKGYIGPDLEQMFLHLFQAAADLIDGEVRPGAYRQDVDEELFKRGDLDDIIERASVGVVMLDEFDKWMGQRRLDDHGRNKGLSLQYELLTILEGATVWVTDSEEELGERFDTSRVLIIAAGAFYGPPSLSAILQRRLRREEEIQSRRAAVPWELLEPVDFQEFGIVPELSGRLTIHLPFVDLRAPEMQAILQEEGGLAEEYIARAHEEGIDLHFQDGALLAIGDVAAQRETGARGLRHVLEGLLAKALVECSLQGVPELVITAQHARENRVTI